MKYFLNKLMLFSLIPLFGLIIGLLVIFYTSENIDYKINSNVKEVFAGDSHVQCAINDNLLKNSKNISTNSESFYFTYFKLKKLLEANKQIQKVYLGASYHSLSNYYDDYISGNFSASVSPKYFFLMPFEEQLKLIKWNISSLSEFLKRIFSICYRYLFQDVRFDYGGYVNNFKNTKAIYSSMDKRLNFQYFSDNKLRGFSEVNLLYLNKIIALCDEMDIELVLINTPVHPHLKNRIPTAFLRKYNEIIKSENLRVLEINNLTFNESSFIPDGDHLSMEGAVIFTNAISALKN
jgi:hypothetical protein